MAVRGLYYCDHFQDERILAPEYGGAEESEGNMLITAAC